MKLVKNFKKIYINIKKKISNPKFKKRINISLITTIISGLLYIIIKFIIIGDSYKLWSDNQHFNEISLGFIFITIRSSVRVIVEHNYLKLINFIIKITLWFKSK